MIVFANNIRHFHSKYRGLKLKWIYNVSKRQKSTIEPKNKAYSHTILSPKTNFPARSNKANKDEIQKAAQFSNLYEWQRKHLTGQEFVLHDGPPYANGELHMGHAVNKILKDINNRSQVLQGNKVHYIPGWDCHGLPIELKALQKAKKTKTQVNDPVQIRKIAREFALATVEQQKASFQSWGVMADWDKQFYLTMNGSYTRSQLMKFYELYKMGLIFRALKPVYWSPSSRTALAEAELEYDPQFKSTEVYVTFPLENVPSSIHQLAKGKRIKALIWTTTPWTLVANRAICYSPTMKYSLVSMAGSDYLYLMGSSLVESLGKILGVELMRVAEFDGKALKGASYRHRLLDRTSPFLPGEHVTDSKGTGLVHTAPAHAPDDFLIALNNGISVECNVDETGCYTNLDPELNGKPVLTEGSDLVINRLGSDVIYQAVYKHSYPLDWRTKQPVILRASQQWFIDTGSLKQKALKALESVELLPQSSSEKYRHGFKSLLAKRPYWCISRQRAWGVPIPVLYNKDEPIVDTRIIERLCDLMERVGPDVWWTADVTDLLPDDVIKDLGLDVKDVWKGKDIMDIWLDSGVSWQVVGRGAELCAEGLDQLTGWFQASLLTALPLTGYTPYKSLFVHGFVVDEKKRKMSKSIGNVIDPVTIINGGKDKTHQPAYGIDVLRWWVASHGTQHTQIILSKGLLLDCQNEVMRIRNILKYLLGAVNDLKKTDFDRKPELNFLDQYLVQESYDLVKNINEHYNNYRYNHVAQSVLYFISNKVSGLYFQCVKDRLYCSSAKSNERLSAQLVIHTIFTTLCKSLGPVLPHLVEEAWQHHPLYNEPFFFTQNLPVLPSIKVDSSLMDTILDIKRDLCVLTKNETLRKYNAIVRVENDLYCKLFKLNATYGLNDSVLSEIFELSSVELENVDHLGAKWELEVCQSKNKQCLRCRKYNAMEDSDKCMRCDKVVSE